MCSAPKVDRSIQIQQQQEAEAARRKEEERQARIKAGTQTIDAQFSAFDDSYLDNRRTAYTGYYQPQLEDKFTKAKEALTYALARAGTLNSTVAGQRQADLIRDYDVQRAAIDAQAENDRNTFAGRIQNEKSALVSQLNATGDADRASNEALARTQMLQQSVPDYNPLGDIFAGVTNGLGNFMQGQNDAAILAAGGVTRSPRRSTMTYVE